VKNSRLGELSDDLFFFFFWRDDEGREVNETEGQREKSQVSPGLLEKRKGREGESLGEV